MSQLSLEQPPFIYHTPSSAPKYLDSTLHTFRAITHNLWDVKYLYHYVTKQQSAPLIVIPLDSSTDCVTINMLPSWLVWATIYQFRVAARYVLQDNDTSIVILKICKHQRQTCMQDHAAGLCSKHSIHQTMEVLFVSMSFSPPSCFFHMHLMHWRFKHYSWSFCTAAHPSPPTLGTWNQLLIA